jgi:molecular chaperone DnaK
VEIHVLQGERQMAKDNMSLGRFTLEGIPPAPRGVPQIEVTFNLDANGILNVSAKDKGTGKEQTITIKSSSGLEDSEVERMVNEAQQYAEEDRKRKELVEARNQADSLVYTTEKTLKELGDKVDESKKEKINEKLEALRSVKDADDIEKIKSATEELTNAMYEISSELYQQQAQEQAQQEQQQGQGASQQQQRRDDDVVDADYTVVDDDEEER